MAVFEISSQKESYQVSWFISQKHKFSLFTNNYDMLNLNKNIVDRITPLTFLCHQTLSTCVEPYITDNAKFCSVDYRSYTYTHWDGNINGVMCHGLALYHIAKVSDTIGKAALNSVCGYRKRNLIFIPELHWKLAFICCFLKFDLILITARLNFSFTSHSGFPSFWRIWIWWRKFSERLWRHFRDWSTVPRKADEKIWDFSVMRRVGSEGILSMSINAWNGGAERMGPRSVQWCPVRVQKTVATNWSTRGSIRTLRNTVWMPKHWHRFLREVVESPSLETVNNCIQITLGHTI